MGIMSHDTMSFWILGLNFFSNYYTVFDQEDMKVGFAISRYAHPRVMEFHQDSVLYAQDIVLVEEAAEIVKGKTSSWPLVGLAMVLGGWALARTRVGKGQQSAKEALI